ncbi:MAG TPA: hypothetical protein PKA53_07870 [Sphingobacterium sp.]|nr:hypothetical protein [Sphingobacterium sp.]
MEFIDFFKQLFIIAFGGCVALVLAFYVIWPKVESYLLRINSINQNKALTQENLQLRFAAYERLILLVHRISPQQVMLRNHGTPLSVAQFRQAILADIDQEFQHNFTQQLYVSDVAWTAVRDLKDSTIALMRNVGKGLREDASLDDYVAVVLRHISELDVNPYDAAQVILKKELSV